MSSFAVSWGILSSAPPTACGIATFTTALGKALARRGDEVSLVRILQDGDECATSPFSVVSELRANNPSSINRASWALNRCDVALIQHEFGLYGGLDGDDVISVMAPLRVPVVTILHTVLSAPTEHQRSVMNRVIELSNCVVVMGVAAEATLRRHYELGAVLVRVIAHGAALDLIPVDIDPEDSPTLLTWGLIGPGKGIEWVIDAMADLRDLRPRPRYIVAGRTHPKVLAYEGDGYRRSLERRVLENGVGDMVIFENSYRKLASLNALIASASVVILPYDSSDQATSGVLVDAIAAGRPVIATSFPHSMEMLSSGAGIVVEHRDPHAIAAAVRTIITDPQAAASLASEARRIAPSLSWDAVGMRYIELARELLSEMTVAVGA
ncbi:MAG: glycosyltransferase [Acidimicrobiaceae bacterium]|nr:glycosyltransferase [Acidimicrobiaceae bacterium]